MTACRFCRLNGAKRELSDCPLRPASKTRAAQLAREGLQPGKVRYIQLPAPCGAPALLEDDGS